MSDVVFFSTWHILGNRSLNQKNLKKFEVSCKAEIPKNKYKKKTSIPILKTQIRGRERLRPRRPRRASLRLGSRTAWGSRSLGRPGARAPGLGLPGSRTMVWSHQLRSRSSPPFCFWFFFSSSFFSGFFSDILVVPFWFVLIYKGYKSSLRDSISM